MFRQFTPHKLPSKKELIDIFYSIFFNTSYDRNLASLRGFLGEKNINFYASARMAFYQSLINFGLKRNDEVILQAFNCAVMSNAVLRIGAKPIYSDIELDILASSVDQITQLITDRTKVIVIQSYMGFTRDMQGLVKFCKTNQIKLILDCSLSYPSDFKKFIEINRHTFDAIIFSFDHGKQINTIVGGMVYYCDEKYLLGNSTISPLSISHSLLLFIWYVYEISVQTKSSFRYLFFILVKILPSPFLSGDFSSSVFNTNYKYPSKMPNFVLKILLLELNGFGHSVNKVRFHTNSIIKNLSQENHLFDRYTNLSDFYDISNRIFYLDDSSVNLDLSGLTIVPAWFNSPLMGHIDELKNYGLNVDLIPNTIFATKHIVNLRIN